MNRIQTAEGNGIWGVQRLHRMKIGVFFLSSIFALVMAGTSYGAHPLVTDDTGTQGKGKTQIEMNAEFARNREDGVKETSAELAWTLTYGAADTVDIVLGLPYQWLRSKDGSSPTIKENGISDMSLEVKWRFFEKDSISLALKTGVSLPTGNDNKGLGSGKVGYSIFLTSTFEAGPLAIHTNLAFIRNENDDDERKNLWHVSAAAEYGVTERLRLVGNIGIERNTDRNLNQHPAFVLGGLIYSLTDKVDIDFGIKAGLNRPETDYAVLAGLAWRY